MPHIPEISAAEFQVLKILWKKEPQSVREVHDQLTQVTGWAYSTTKTTMDRMAKKELLQRQSFHGVFLYQSLVSKSQGLVKWVRFFADGILETDYSNVVNMFSQSGNLSESEIEELRDLLDKDNGGKND